MRGGNARKLKALQRAKADEEFQRLQEQLERNKGFSQGSGDDLENEGSNEGSEDSLEDS